MKKLILYFITILLLIFTTGCGKTENSDVLRVGMDLKYYPFTGTDESDKRIPSVAILFIK